MSGLVLDIGTLTKSTSWRLSPLSSGERGRVRGNRRRKGTML
jgi:hypothetical protein